jgi:hypothetical protein
MWVSGSEVIPSKGDRVMQFRTGGLIREGYVWYADQLQVLVKWDNGASSSLRRGGDSFAVASSNGASANGAAPHEPVPVSRRRFDPSPLPRRRAELR